MFPEDEAGSPEYIKMRQEQAPSLFLGAYTSSKEDKGDGLDKGRLVAFIMATLAETEHLTEASMKEHHPEGRLVCLHSVCVDSPWQGMGYAKAILREFIRRVQEIVLEDGKTPRYRAIALLTHKPLIHLYTQVGFTLLGPSTITHGPDLWYDMELPILPK